MFIQSILSIILLYSLSSCNTESGIYKIVKPKIVKPKDSGVTKKTDKKKEPDLKKDAWKNKNLNLNFYFIRHAQSRTNATWNVLEGLKYDTELSTDGEEQCKDLKLKIISGKLNNFPHDFHIVGASVLKRAIHTSYLLFGDKHNITVLPCLRESRTTYGNWPQRVGGKYPIFFQKNSFNKEQQSKINYKFVRDINDPNIFSSQATNSDIDEFLKFICDNMSKLIKDINKFKNNSNVNIAIVTHSYYLKDNLGALARPKNLGVFHFVGKYNKNNGKIMLRNKKIDSFEQGKHVIFKGYAK